MSGTYIVLETSSSENAVHVTGSFLRRFPSSQFEIFESKLQMGAQVTKIITPIHHLKGGG